MEERIRYADERPYMVPETLEELTGPVHGAVDLPPRLDWSERLHYHLDDPAELGLMYERVIRESMSINDLRQYLNADVLRRVWRRIFLPARVRRLWEERFPGLGLSG